TLRATDHARFHPIGENRYQPGPDVNNVADDLWNWEDRHDRSRYADALLPFFVEAARVPVRVHSADNPNGYLLTPTLRTATWPEVHLWHHGGSEYAAWFPTTDPTPAAPHELDFAVETKADTDEADDPDVATTADPDAPDSPGNPPPGAATDTADVQPPAERTVTEPEPATTRLDGGISTLPADDPSAAAAALLGHPDRYHVVGHGRTDHLEAGGRQLSAADLAREIRADDRWQGRPVVLASCWTGADPRDGFATELARALPGTKVVAPDGVAWTTSSGYLLVTPDDHSGLGGLPALGPDAAGTGRFWQFETAPDGAGEVTATPMPPVIAPGEALGAVDVDALAYLLEERAQEITEEITRAAAPGSSTEQAAEHVRAARDAGEVALQAPHDDSRLRALGTAFLHLDAARATADGTGPGPEPLVAPLSPIAEEIDVRDALPSYLTENRTLGLAEQVRTTEDADLAGELRRRAPSLNWGTLAEVQDDVSHNLAALIGRGRPYPVTVNGQPAELTVQAKLDLRRLDVEATGETSSVSNEAHGGFGGKLRVTQDRQLEPRASLWAVPPAVFIAGASLPAAPHTTRGSELKTHYHTSTELELGEQTRVAVPVRITATLRDADGRPMIGFPIKVDGRTVLNVPTTLQEPAPLPAHAPAVTKKPPARFAVEAGYSTPDPTAGSYFEQVEAMLGELGLDDLTRIGAPGRTVLQEMFSDTAIAEHLNQSITHDPDNKYKGWVNSDALVRSHKGWRRLFPGRNRAVQYRMVARQVQYIETVHDAEHTDKSRRDVTTYGSTSADRSANALLMAGGGMDAAPVSFLVGGRAGAGVSKSHTQYVSKKASNTRRVTGEGPVVRYRTVYDLEVRVVGHESRFLQGKYESLQLATHDR
ncbi:MAG TPA: hypothetical protein VFG35_02615, partial [Actinoplanes sp.]|nr:hypothetical protein [Actinoplanes sp.]